MHRSPRCWFFNQSQVICLVGNPFGEPSRLIDSLFLDAFASLTNMIGIYHALKPADERRAPFWPWKKAESLAALGQALFIGGSSFWLLHEAYNRFFLHQPLESTRLGILVMTVAILVTFCLVGYQQYVIKKTQSRSH